MKGELMLLYKERKEEREVKHVCKRGDVRKGKRGMCEGRRLCVKLRGDEEKRRMTFCELEEQMKGK